MPGGSAPKVERSNYNFQSAMAMACGLENSEPS